MTLRTMVGALWYLQSRSLLNSIKARLRRLRQPKYLIGSILGGLYFLSIFGRWMMGGMLLRGNRPAGDLGPVTRSADMENLGATVLLGFLLSGWVFAKDRAALTFTEPEVTYLFPAPLSRSLLLWYRIFRAQTAILFTTLMLLILTGRILQGFGAFSGAFGWWILLSTLSLHGLGASFAVQRMTDRGLAGGGRRLLTLAVPVSAFVVIWVWYQSLPVPPTLAVDDTPGRFLLRWQHFSGEVFRSGPAPWFLAPFRWVVRPLFATGWADAVGRFLPALAILGLHAVWVLRSAVSFEEASIEHSRRQAERVTSVRGGRLGVRPRKRAEEPFELRPIGARWVALWWCGLIESRDTPRRWLLFAGVAVVAVIALRLLAPNTSAPMVVGLIALGICGLVVLLGGQSAAQQFARTLRQLDLIKAFPVAGWEVFLGTMLGGITGALLLEGLLLAGSAALLTGAFERGPTGLTAVGILWPAAALAAPVATLFLALPVSIGFVLFPGWFAATQGNPGVEAMGQRMLVGFFQLLILGVAVLPVAVTGVPGYFLGAWLIGPTAGILVAVLAGTLVLAAECVLGIWWIGRRFEALNAADET